MEKIQTQEAGLTTSPSTLDALNQERDRIIKELDAIDINTTSQINALGMKILIKEIINSKRENILPE